MLKYIDDHHRNPNMKNRDHLVGKLTMAGESTLGTNSDDLFRTFSSKELHFERPEYTWY